MCIKKVSISSLTENYLKEYGYETIENRALPSFQDGLKPVQRRILWSMYNLKLFYNSSLKKSARIVGDTLGKYHPHGDLSCYNALVNMTQFNEPLADGKESNFGDWESPPASSRYTETRLTKYAQIYLLNKDYLEVVHYIDNYDGEFKEPVYLPSLIPNILVNGAEGIATGCSTFIPSFSLESVLNLLKHILKTEKEVTVDDCLKFLKFSFPYGGEVVNTKKEIKEIFEKGEGTLYVRPSYKQIDNKTIYITSVCPRFNREKVFAKLDALKEVKQVNDISKDNKITFEIVFKKNLNQDLIKKFEDIITYPLKVSVIYTERVLDKNKNIKVSFHKSNLSELVNKWLSFRKELEILYLNNEQNKLDKKLNKLKLMRIASLHKDIVIKCLDKQNPDMFIVKQLKKKGINITKEDANFILSLQIRQLTNLEQNEIKNKIKEIEKQIKEVKQRKKNVSKSILLSLE